jgi:hypothetical protein
MHSQNNGFIAKSTSFLLTSDAIHIYACFRELALSCLRMVDDLFELALLSFSPLSPKMDFSRVTENG